MPSSNQPVTFRVSPEYRAFLDDLREAVEADSLSDLIEISINYLAVQYGMDLPLRAHPIGYNGPLRGKIPE